MTSSLRLRLLAALAALTCVALAPVAASADDDLQTQACKNLQRVAKATNMDAAELEDLDKCRAEMTKLGAECTNGDAVLACIAAVDGKTEQEVGEAFLGCAMKCVPPEGPLGPIVDRKPPEPITAVAPSAEVAAACENLATVARAEGEDVKPEDMPECYKGLPEIMSMCANGEAVLACISTTKSKAGFEECVATCEIE